MKKILIYGTEVFTDALIRTTFKDATDLSEYGIAGFIDTDKAREKSSFLGLPVFSMSEVRKMQFDMIVVVCDEDYPTVHNMLAYGYGFGADKVIDVNYLLKIKIVEDFKNGISGNTQDAELEQTVRQMDAADGFDVFCGYCQKPEEEYEVVWDDDLNMPYVMFEGKKMYYPRSYIFNVINGKQYIKGLEYEQQEGSPHTYITDDIYIKEGDVVIDAGVCEGNFAIKYIDRVSKLYLIEGDPEWFYPLMLTFRDYSDKVEFCFKYLGNVDDDKTVTIDSLVGDGRVDFIKMDIEGAEIDALSGAENAFRNNNIRCSICSYHKHNDEMNIRNILESYGYATSTSHGHMIFHLDNERFIWSELRHGIVYGKKEEAVKP